MNHKKIRVPKIGIKHHADKLLKGGKKGSGTMLPAESYHVKHVGSSKKYKTPYG